MKVFEEELLLITGRDMRHVTRAAQLAGQTLIAFVNACSYRKRMEEWLGTDAVLPLRTLELASHQAMIACVAAGTGYALVPKSLLSSVKASSEVKQHALPARIRRNRTHLLWHGTPSAALEKLRSLLHQCAHAAS